MDKQDLLYIGGGSVPTLWKTVGHNLMKLNIFMPYDLTILLLGKLTHMPGGVFKNFHSNTDCNNTNLQATQEVVVGRKGE